MKETSAARTSLDSLRVSVVRDVQSASVVLPPAVVLCYKEEENISMNIHPALKLDALSGAGFGILPTRTGITGWTCWKR